MKTARVALLAAAVALAATYEPIRAVATEGALVVRDPVQAVRRRMPRRRDETAGVCRCTCWHQPIEPPVP